MVEAATYKEYEDGDGQDRRVTEARSGRDELGIEALPNGRNARWVIHKLRFHITYYLYNCEN